HLFSCVSLHRPPLSTIFPYTTLFRSSPFLREMAENRSAADRSKCINDPGRRLLCHVVVPLFAQKSLIHVLCPVRHGVECRHQERSEEHTSELQSLAYLVCRLLLEKKK